MTFFKTRDPVDLDAAAREEKEHEEVAESNARHAAEDFIWIMSDKRGRRFVWGVLERSGFFRPSFDGTAEGTIYADGMKNEARHLMALLAAHTPQALTIMLKEQHDDGSSTDSTN